MGIPIRKLIRECFPPIFLRAYRCAVRRSGFYGNYPTWDDARKEASGYDSALIVQKVCSSLLKVKKGEAAYERDSVLFDAVQYSWPLVAALLWIASQNGNRVNLIDFGGSLGSSYFQNRKFLAHLQELRWNIVEQNKFVACGKRYFEDEHLRFHDDLDACLQEQHSESILLSSVLQYLEKPYDLLRKIIQNRFTYVVIDRTPFLQRGGDRITVQKVPAEIYPASYPCWLFNQRTFIDFFSASYEVIAGFESADQADIPAVFKGYIFKRKGDV